MLFVEVIGHRQHKNGGRYLSLLINGMILMILVVVVFE
jgi:hypothetical protein